MIKYNDRYVQFSSGKGHLPLTLHGRTSKKGEEHEDEYVHSRPNVPCTIGDLQVPKGTVDCMKREIEQCKNAMQVEVRTRGGGIQSFKSLFSNYGPSDDRR